MEAQVQTPWGGAGADTYDVDDAGDFVDELFDFGDGIDTVRSQISFSLAEDTDAEKTNVKGVFENLILLGGANLDGYGNAVDNTLTGNDGANKLYGRDGNDTLYGGKGSDVLSGGIGNDTLDGGGENDNLKGGAGDDTYVVDNIKDCVDELNDNGNGTDTIRSSISFNLTAGTYVLGSVENLTLLGSAALNGTGNAGNNTLTGNAGANALNGGGGADTMVGGAGNDTYDVDNAGDVVDELAEGGNGIDTVASWISFDLAGSQVKGTVENLALQGLANLTGTGNAADNTITGNSGVNTLNGKDGNDTLDGGAGSDTMVGGTGNDTYVVGDSVDVVDEVADGGAGIDTVRSAITFSLLTGTQVKGTVENLTLLGTAALNGTGNAGNNTLVGNGGINQLAGGAGNDTLTGGAGADYFLFNTALNATNNLDKITDFSVAADTIRLDNAIFAVLTTAVTLASTAFWIGTAAHEADDRIIYNSTTGALTYDTNGNVAGGATQFATLLTKPPTLTYADFAVV